MKVIILKSGHGNYHPNPKREPEEIDDAVAKTLIAVGVAKEPKTKNKPGPKETK